MKFSVIASATLASVAAAAPDASEQARCKPGSYRCTASGGGWDTCNTTGDWVAGGLCPWGTKCYMDPRNQSPYCLRPGFVAVKIENVEI